MSRNSTPKLIEITVEEKDGVRHALYTILGEVMQVKCSKCKFWKFAGPGPHDIGGYVNGKPVCKNCK